jgi:hypothetical protein
MSAATVLARGRAAAQALMVDACTIQRVTSSPADPDTGQITYTYSTVYTGQCKVQQAAPASGPAEVGEAEIFESILTLHLPATVTGLQPDDKVTVTASAHDPDLVGRVFHLRGLAHKSFATAHRYPLIEVTG